MCETCDDASARFSLLTRLVTLAGDLRPDVCTKVLSVVTQSLANSVVSEQADVLAAALAIEKDTSPRCTVEPLIVLSQQVLQLFVEAAETERIMVLTRLLTLVTIEIVFSLFHSFGFVLKSCIGIRRCCNSDKLRIQTFIDVLFPILKEVMKKNEFFFV